MSDSPVAQQRDVRPNRLSQHLRDAAARRLDQQLQKEREKAEAQPDGDAPRADR